MKKQFLRKKISVEFWLKSGEGVANVLFFKFNFNFLGRFSFMAKKKAVAAGKKGGKKAQKSGRDVLVVASKVKEYIKTKGTSGKILVAGDFAANLSEAVYGLIDKAIVRAQENKRSTVQPKDI